MCQKLNENEVSIIRMLKEGKDSLQMAQELCLSVQTIYWYRKRLLKKYDAKSMTALIAKILENDTINKF